jgi:ABC-type glycerol-3-phosphate transport system permease component
MPHVRSAGRAVAAPSLRQRMFVSTGPGRFSPTERAVAYVLLIAVALILIAPFYFVIVTSLKESKALFEYPPKWIPTPLYFGNYERLLFDTAFPRWMLNTLFVATTVAALKVFIDSLAGYAFAKMNFRGRNGMFLLMIAMLMVPFGAILIPLYAVANAIGITNTYLALILPPLANPLGMFLMRQFIVGLPKDLENAARLDGVSEFGIYWRIILPLVKPGLVVLAVIVFTDMYMSFLWPLVSVSDADLTVMTVGVGLLRTFGATNFGLSSAAAVMALVPIALLFFPLQKQFLSRSITGALKQ